MSDAVTESLSQHLENDLRLRQGAKDCYDVSVQLYADNGLLPQSLADEMKRNTTGAELMKGLLAQMENYPYIHIPIGEPIVAHRELPSFYDNRPDCLDARICALRYSSEPAIHKDGFIKIIPTEP